MNSLREKLKVLFRPRFEYKKYSRLGIFSFILALLIALIIIGDIITVLRLQNDPTSVQSFRVLDPLITWLMAFLAFAGIVLGIAAVVQKQKKRLFGLVGLIFNGVFLMGIFSLYILNTIAFWRAAGAGG